jgi:magnesium transporter
MPAFPSKQSTGIDKTTTPFKTVERNFAGPPKWYPQHVTYRERLGGYLHPRDMRRLVTPFSSSNEPELIVRRHVMLLNFDPLRAIVLRDRLLVLVPDGADSILETLTQRVEGGLSEESVFGTEHVIEPSEPSSQAMREDESLTSMKEPSAPGKRASDPSQKEGKKSAERKPTEKKRHHSFPSFEKKSGIHDYHEGRRYENYEDEEWDDLKGKQWIDLPFELQSVDAVLHTVSIMLTEESNELQGYAYAAIEELLAASNLSGAHGHEILRSCKGELNQMTRRVQGFIRAINQVLDEDEDLALMNLSRLITHPERFIQPVSEEILHEESDEPELILEAYLQESLTNQNSLDLLKGEITTIEELVNMKLDTIRNRLLFVNTVVR